MGQEDKVDTSHMTQMTDCNRPAIYEQNDEVLLLKLRGGVKLLQCKVNVMKIAV